MNGVDFHRASLSLVILNCILLDDEKSFCPTVLGTRWSVHRLQWRWTRRGRDLKWWYISSYTSVIALNNSHNTLTFCLALISYRVLLINVVIMPYNPFFISGACMQEFFVYRCVCFMSMSSVDPFLLRCLGVVWNYNQFLGGIEGFHCASRNKLVIVIYFLWELQSGL